MKFVSHNKHMYRKLKTIPWIKKVHEKKLVYASMIAKRTKNKICKTFFGGVYIYLDLLFSVHTIQEKKRNSIVKKILSTQID